MSYQSIPLSSQNIIHTSIVFWKSAFERSKSSANDNLRIQITFYGLLNLTISGINAVTQVKMIKQPNLRGY